MARPELSMATVREFLASRHGAEVDAVEALGGGYWSAAFGYRVSGRDLVARFGSIRSGFEMDRAAMAFAGPDLPVPEVIEVGDAFGGAYALSVRHYGRFLEDAPLDAAGTWARALLHTLTALRRRAASDGPVAWYQGEEEEDGAPASWRDWLRQGLVDDPAQHVHGWRDTLAADAGVDRVFRACEARIDELLPHCPERRDLVHGDLLNRNVLVAGDGSQVTAVFSWKCSVRGDFLFDLAWCTFWGQWHPGVAAMELWQRTLDGPVDSPDDLRDAALRHHCYELQIAASHLGWMAWTEDDEGLQRVAAAAAGLLARGLLDQ